MLVMVAATCSGCAIGFAGSPTDVSVNGAHIPGKVVSNLDGPADYWLEYGSTAALGSRTPSQSATLEAGTPCR